IFVQNCRPFEPKHRFNARNKNLAEEIGPGVVAIGFNRGRSCRSGKGIAIAVALRIQCGQEVDPGEALEGFRHGQTFGFKKGIAGAASETQHFRRCRARCRSEQIEAVADHGIVIFASAIPFEHREFRGVQRPALAIAEYAREFENPFLAGCEQFLAGEFGRGVQIEAPALALRRYEFGRKSVEMRFVAGRALQYAAFYLKKTGNLEMAPQGFLDAIACPQAGAAIRMLVGIPPALRRHRPLARCRAAAMTPRPYAQRSFRWFRLLQATSARATSSKKMESSMSFSRPRT